MVCICADNVPRRSSSSSVSSTQLLGLFSIIHAQMRCSVLISVNRLVILKKTTRHKLQRSVLTRVQRNWRTSPEKVKSCGHLASPDPSSRLAHPKSYPPLGTSTWIKRMQYASKFAQTYEIRAVFSQTVGPCRYNVPRVGTLPGRGSH
jgi:hypothetical protein